MESLEQKLSTDRERVYRARKNGRQKHWNCNRSTSRNIIIRSIKKWNNEIQTSILLTKTITVPICVGLMFFRFVFCRHAGVKCSAIKTNCLLKGFIYL